MIEEANYDRYKAIRAGHRGTLMRLTKEIDDVLIVEMLNDEHHQKLKVIHRQLEAKAKVLTELDSDIMKCFVNSTRLKEKFRKLILYQPE